MHTALCDLEGLATDPTARCVWALAEETGQVVCLATGGRRRTLKPLGRLARPGRREQGVRGAGVPSARTRPTAAIPFSRRTRHLRRVGVFALPDLSQTHEFKLPRDAKEALADLADLTVDPVTGAWLLLSEESRRIGVFAVEPDRLRLESLTDVRVDDGERPEGLDFVTPGRLVVVTEGPPGPSIFALHAPAREPAQPSQRPRCLIGQRHRQPRRLQLQPVFVLEDLD